MKDDIKEAKMKWDHENKWANSTTRHGVLDCLSGRSLTKGSTWEAYKAKFGHVVGL